MSETVRPLTSLADWFGGAIKLLRLGLQTHGPHGSPEASLLLPLVWGMLARVNRRFDAVLAAVAAGRRFISKPRRSRAKPADRAAPPPPADTAEGAKLRLPRRAGWLLHLAPGINTNMGRFRLETLLAHPDLPALLEAAPHAARMLRPLARALLVPLPPCLQTARARAAAAKPAKPALGAAEPSGRRQGATIAGSMSATT